MANLTTLIFILATCCAAVLSQTKPKACRKYDCPSYNSTAINSQTESRVFTTETHWVSTSLTSPTSGLNRLQRRNMFMKLFGYIKGANADGRRIEMTIPVPKKFTSLPSGDTDITMSFYLTDANSPQPTNTDLFLESMPLGKTFYVRSFQTNFRASKADYNENLAILEADLTAAGLTFDTRSHYESGLTPPWEFPKKNEIWVEAL